MKFEVNEEELVEFIKGRYEDDYAEKILRNFSVFREVFEEEVILMEDEFLEIFTFCVDEAIDKLNGRI